MFDFSGFRCKRLHPNAVLPHKYDGDAGYDMHSVESGTIEVGGRRKFRLGFAAELPYGKYCQLKDRSGLADDHGLTVLAGVMDNGYRGEYMVILHNTSPQPYEIRAGDKVCQGVIRRFANPVPCWVDELTETERGEGGFGSTGQ